MKQDDIEDLTQSFLVDFLKYASENIETDLKNNIKQYLIQINYIKKDQLMVDIIRTSLKNHGYFEATQKVRDIQQYRLTEKGNIFLRRMNELNAKIYQNPKFFMPLDVDVSKSIEIWTDLKKSVCVYDKLTHNKKVYKLVSRHNGLEMLDEVGRITKSNNEVVIAIIETDDRFYVFTQSRGYLKSDPMMVGKSSVIATVYFDD